jgi:hypothetical protein
MMKEMRRASRECFGMICELPILYRSSQFMRDDLVRCHVHLYQKLTDAFAATGTNSLAMGVGN